jgi:hypothetical protein
MCAYYKGMLPWWDNSQNSCLPPDLGTLDRVSSFMYSMVLLTQQQPLDDVALPEVKSFIFVLHASEQHITCLTVSGVHIYTYI